MSERRVILLKNLTLNEKFIFLFFLWFNLITKLYLKNNTNILNSKGYSINKKIIHKHRGLDKEIKFSNFIINCWDICAKLIFYKY